MTGLVSFLRLIREDGRRYRLLELVATAVSVAGCKPSVDSAAASLDEVLLAATAPLDAPPAVLPSPLDATTMVLPAPVARRPWGSTPG